LGVVLGGLRLAWQRGMLGSNNYVLTLVAVLAFFCFVALFSLAVHHFIRAMEAGRAKAGT